MELISNNGYGLYFMKLGGALAAKIIDIDLQHTPTVRLCSPWAIRSRKERRLVSWTQTMHKNYFLAFFAYLRFQVANIVAFIYWSSELVTKNQCRPFFLELGGFSDFKNKGKLLNAQFTWAFMVYDSLKAKPLSCVYGNRGTCSSFPFILQVQTMCLQVAMPFKYFDHV